MCGIIGFLNYQRPLLARSSKLLDLISHRGPDGSGLFIDQNILIGMNRLRFRGSDCELPLVLHDNVYAFNGQIYGYFNDYGEYYNVEDGIENEIAAAMALNNIDGMYAIAKYIPALTTVFLSTDSHFIKPIFVRSINNSYCFSSELRPLLDLCSENKININALTELFMYGWYLSEESWISGIYLPWKKDILISPAGMELLEKKKEIDTCISSADSHRLRSAVRESVEKSVQGDGPFGLALSGGLDSSILAFELNELGVESVVCITLHGDDKTSTILSLEELCLPPGGAWTTWKHIHISLNQEHYLNAFKQATILFGQPTTMSSLPYYLQIASAAGSEGVRAMLLGEGVDEFFVGYNSYRKIDDTLPILDYYKSPVRNQLLMNLFDRDLLDQTRQKFYDAYSDLSDIRPIEADLRLTRLLLRTDMCLMRYSIEGRVPFLYNQIPQIALSFPWSKSIVSPGKYLLRSAYADLPGGRSMKEKVRFKSSDSMLQALLAEKDQQAFIIDECSKIFKPSKLQAVINLLMDDKFYSADIHCLLLSLAYLLEEGCYSLN